MDQHQPAEPRPPDRDENFWPGTRLSLILRLKAEPDGYCWTEFVGLYGPLILKFCLRRLPQDQAEDVTQAVFIRIFRCLPRFEYDPAKGRFGGWIGRITRNEILRHVEKWHRNDRHDFNLALVITDVSRGKWEDEFNEWVMRTALQRVKDAVSPEQWRLFEESWGTGQKPAEVAARLSIQASRVHKARCIVVEKLRAVIRELCDDHPFSEPERGK